jgi:2-hydroxychromene-2-carboxylate isomerase
MIVDVIAKAGLETEGLASRIDDPAVVDALAANCKEAAERGIFGAPTIMIGEAMFFGNDRLEFVREHLRTEKAA